jgi:holo-[acyl-carrier protein] synthase
MIVGIGNDICDVRRIESSLTRHGERFAQRILTPAEIQVWRSRSARWPDRGVRYVATRFSAKEAFSKAIGLGLRLPMSWQACSVLNRPSGQPWLHCHGALAAWMQHKGWEALVSISDESDYVMSTCLVQQADAFVTGPET